MCKIQASVRIWTTCVITTIIILQAELLTQLVAGNGMFNITAAPAQDVEISYSPSNPPIQTVRTFVSPIIPLYLYPKETKLDSNEKEKFGERLGRHIRKNWESLEEAEIKDDQNVDFLLKYKVTTVRVNEIKQKVKDYDLVSNNSTNVSSLKISFTIILGWRYREWKYSYEELKDDTILTDALMYYFNSEGNLSQLISDLKLKEKEKSDLQAVSNIFLGHVNRDDLDTDIPTRSPVAYNDLYRVPWSNIMIQLDGLPAPLYSNSEIQHFDKVILTQITNYSPSTQANIYNIDIIIEYQEPHPEKPDVVNIYISIDFFLINQWPTTFFFEIIEGSFSDIKGKRFVKKLRKNDESYDKYNNRTKIFQNVTAVSVRLNMPSPMMDIISNVSSKQQTPDDKGKEQIDKKDKKPKNFIAIIVASSLLTVGFIGSVALARWYYVDERNTETGRSSTFSCFKGKKEKESSLIDSYSPSSSMSSSSILSSSSSSVSSSWECNS